MATIDVINSIVNELKATNQFKSNKAIAEAIPYDYAYFTKVLNGKNKLSYDFENAFFKRFPKSEYYKSVNNYSNDNPKLDEVHEKGNVSYGMPSNFMEVPIIPIHAQAGLLSGYGDTAYWDGLPTEIWEVDKEYKGNYVVFEVKGDSMDNNSVESILEGDRILCREIQQHHWKYKLHINKWNFVVVHKDEGIIVKRITEHNVDTGDITCHSINPYYDDIKVNLKDVIALYNVVDLKRNLRL